MTTPGGRQQMTLGPRARGSERGWVGITASGAPGGAGVVEPHPGIDPRTMPLSRPAQRLVDHPGIGQSGLWAPGEGDQLIAGWPPSTVRD